MIFLDTNILLYLVDQTSRNRSKQEMSRQLLGRVDIVLSTQVLIEFCNNAFRPKDKRNLLTHSEVSKLVTSWTRFQIVPVTIELILAALQSKVRFGISHLDALIVEAAKSAGCLEIYSEDLNHNQEYGGVRVINPFRQGS